jgi:membrane fusion protein (multidrug efflux system)
MAEADLNSVSQSQEDATRSNRRKKLLTGIAIAVVAAGVVAGGWYVLIGSRHVTTDNAYVGADTATITPMVAGQIAEVDVQDTQVVHKGDVLVRIDPRDAQIALNQAEADLAKAKRQYGQTTLPARRWPRRSRPVRP